MSDQNFYLLSYFYGTNTSYKIYSDKVFKTIDAVREAGLFNSTNPQLLAIDPTGEIELSRNLIISTATAFGDLQKAAKLDVQRNFTVGNFTFAPDGRISGNVTGAIHVRSDGSFEGKYFANPISLDSYGRQQSLELIRNSPGKKVSSLDPFKRYLPSGWQKKPFGNNFISVNSKSNSLTSSSKGKTFKGNSKVDKIIGTAKDDIIIGAGAADRLTGGKGKDRFVYNTINDSRPGPKNRDTITDFNGREGDRIDLRKIDGNTKIKGNQKLTFIGSKAFSGKGGEIRFSGGILQVDNNLDRKSDMEIALTKVASFSQDFLIL